MLLNTLKNYKRKIEFYQKSLKMPKNANNNCYFNLKIALNVFLFKITADRIVTKNGGKIIQKMTKISKNENSLLSFIKFH